MIQSKEGQVLLTNDNDAVLLADLDAICYALVKKGLSIDAIMEATSRGISCGIHEKLEADDASKKKGTVFEDDVFNKMFGDLWND